MDPERRVGWLCREGPHNAICLLIASYQKSRMVLSLRTCVQNPNRLGSDPTSAVYCCVSLGKLPKFLTHPISSVSLHEEMGCVIIPTCLSEELSCEVFFNVFNVFIILPGRKQALSRWMSWPGSQHQGDLHIIRSLWLWGRVPLA